MPSGSSTYSDPRSPAGRAWTPEWVVSAKPFPKGPLAGQRAPSVATATIDTRSIADRRPPPRRIQAVVRPGRALHAGQDQRDESGPVYLQPRNEEDLAHGAADVAASAGSLLMKPAPTPNERPRLSIPATVRTRRPTGCPCAREDDGRADGPIDAGEPRPTPQLADRGSAPASMTL